MNTKNLFKSIKLIKWYEWVMMAIMIAIALYAMVDVFVKPGDNKLPAWLTVVNFISAVCGVFCIFLCAKASISNFVFGVVNTVVYSIFLYYTKKWGTFALEVLVYFPINFISWYIWAKHRDHEQEELTKTKKLSVLQDVFVLGMVALFAVVYHTILVRLNGDVPWLDSLTLTIGIIVVILEMLRYREQYVLWIVQDVIAVIMYIVSFDAVYLTKKSIYLIMAVIGLINWWKLQKTRNIENE